MASGKQDANRLTKEEQMAKVVDLRRLGLSFRDIENQTGISKSASQRLFKKAVEDFSKDLTQKVEACRMVQLASIEAMRRGLWAGAMKGDTQSVSTMLRTMEREAKLLGLDAPQRVEDVTKRTTNDSIVDKMKKKLQERNK